MAAVRNPKGERPQRRLGYAHVSAYGQTLDGSSTNSALIVCTRLRDRAPSRANPARESASRLDIARVPRHGPRTSAVTRLPPLRYELRCVPWSWTGRRRAYRSHAARQHRVGRFQVEELGHSTTLRTGGLGVFFCIEAELDANVSQSPQEDEHARIGLGFDPLSPPQKGFRVNSWPVSSRGRRRSCR